MNLNGIGRLQMKLKRLAIFYVLKQQQNSGDEAILLGLLSKCESPMAHGSLMDFLALF